MAQKKSQTISSPLISAFNNIVNVKRSGSSMQSTQRSYQSFLQFMNVEVRNIEAIPLPNKKKLNKLANLNVASTFGSAGSLLSSLASGALDAAGLVGSLFGGGGKGKAKPNPKAGGAIPKGKGIRLGGLRAIGITNALFAGLDFVQGLQEGESVGKAASGAGGALAGSLIGGAIGQALIPIPGLGFVVGSIAGNFLGGFTGDRAHEAVTGGGDKSLEQKTKQRLKAKEQEQRSKASLITTLTLPQVLDKFEGVVYKFEKTVGNLDLSASSTSEGMGDASGENYGENADPNSDQNQKDTPSGEDVKLDGEGSFIQGSTGKSTGPHFHIGPTQLYDPKGDTWVGKETEQGKKDAREAGFKVAKALMQRKKYFRFTNAGIDVNPGSKLDDDTLMKYVEKEQYAHGNRRGGGSWGGLDIAGSPGLRMPLPVGDVVSSVHGYGNSARIMGTNAFVGHGMKGSKKTDEKQVLRTTPPTAGTENITPQQNAAVSSQTKPIPTSASKQSEDLFKMSTDQLKSKLDPTVTGAANPAVFQAAQQARTKGTESGLTGESLEREVMMASIRAKESLQVQGISQQQVTPQQVQQYPSYNQMQSSTTIIPMMMSSGGGQQRPVVISGGGGGGGGGQTIVMPSAPIGVVLNSLMKSMLLTNLSGT